MPAIRKIVPSRERRFWDSIDPENKKQVLEAVKDEVKPEKKVSGSPCEDLITVSYSLAGQSQHTSFTTVQADRAIFLSQSVRSQSACRVSAIARYSCSTAHSSLKDKVW